MSSPATTYRDAHPNFVCCFLDRQTAERRARGIGAGASISQDWAGGLDVFPVYAPAPLPTPAEALELARAEYAFRPSDFGGYMLLSRGSDGGMHYRDSARGRDDARDWCESRAQELAARISSGELAGLVLFWDSARRRWYLG